ncbi:unnamed protein product [Cladocopium goreaui]|uniref:Uncharacterized protein n=2 Tax=Cladocopium goreaui TaxID=2562237 RepID=A0A9P1FXQ3_9DINO|nr:unnamed protein product [Cladocopium goreaui]
MPKKKDESPDQRDFKKEAKKFVKTLMEESDPKALSLQDVREAVQKELLKGEEPKHVAMFEDNLKNIGLDLTKGFQYFDDTVSGVLNSISVDLINLVDQFIINPLISLLDLFDCTFMAAFWMGLTDSMCLRAMNGLRMIANSYVWVALLSLLIAMLMYVPWRLSKDNLDTANADSAPQSATV